MDLPLFFSFSAASLNSSLFGSSTHLLRILAVAQLVHEQQVDVVRLQLLSSRASTISSISFGPPVGWHLVTRKISFRFPVRSNHFGEFLLRLALLIAVLRRQVAHALAVGVQSSKRCESGKAVPGSSTETWIRLRPSFRVGSGGAHPWAWRLRRRMPAIRRKAPQPSLRPAGILVAMMGGNCSPSVSTPSD